MTVFDPIHGLIGGILIGCAAVLLMLGIGRIAGVCGIMLNLLTARDDTNTPWRAAFLIGLPLGTLLVSVLGLKDLSTLNMPASIPATIVAGVIVITADILLADRCLKTGATVLAPNGKPFTGSGIGNAVAVRAIMADLRAGAVGAAVGGPPPFSKADRSRFLSELDTALVRLKRLHPPTV